MFRLLFDGIYKASDALAALRGRSTPTVLFTITLNVFIYLCIRLLNYPFHRAGKMVSFQFLDLLISLTVIGMLGCSNSLTSSCKHGDVSNWQLAGKQQTILQGIFNWHFHHRIFDATQMFLLASFLCLFLPHYVISLANWMSYSIPKLWCAPCVH